ncbi:RNA polymerase II transcription factor B subunit 4 [Coniosporium apollinis]|uniref:General transcription and DNA repair factor IIH subunit TFB4 n=1 Tax=Coniosporium apollinis TaxID=61459 RepID=A0ABQ9P1R4_9PEZI|nr:RNA polymerase II transcription factor B subunit 4 [Coniosporium apollinis]
MNAIDGTDRHVRDSDNSPPPSLLTIILDTNPHAWALLSDTLPLSKAVANLLVFINAHLSFNHANQVAVIASHIQRAQWLYPTPHPPRNSSLPEENGTSNPTAPSATKYHRFAVIERSLQDNLARLISHTTAADLTSSTTTQIAGALSTALAHISRATQLSSPADSSGISLDSTGPTLSNPTDAPTDPADGTPRARRSPLTSRILIVSVSGDLAAQYIPVMNTIFAAQRQRVPLDVLKLAGDTVFLQQAADATGGVYIAPSSAAARAGLLQYLMMGFLPNARARAALVMPGGGEVDFRAACFCHRRVVDVGFVCSVCLSIFCEPLEEGECLTCGTRLSLGAAVTAKPVVVPRPKKKKKRKLGDVTGTSTPMSAGTPGP